MHSFVSIISSHGKNLPGPFLDHLLTGTLHPMLDEIVTKTASASTVSSASAASAKLGTEGGRDVMMMVHHSRDTEAKQWDETWVLALDAAVRLYRGFLPQLLICDSFERAWSMLLGFINKSLLSMPRSLEVALASITAVHSLMLSSVQLSTQGGPSPRSSSDDPAATAPASPKSPPSLQRANTVPVTALVPATALVPVASPADGPGSAVQLASGLMSIAASTGPVERERLPPKLWASVWSMLETAIEQATTDSGTFATHEKMLCALANRTADLYDGGRGYFEEADVLRLLQLSERLVRSPERSFGWEPTQPTSAPSALQNAVLHLLAKLPPFGSPGVREDEMWPLLLWLLLKLLEPPTAPTPVALTTTPVALTSPAATAKAPATAPASAEKPRGSSPTGFGEKCYQLLHRLLTEEASPAAKLAVAEDVLNVMRRIMAWRLNEACISPGLPRAVASGFVTLLEAILAHLPSAAADPMLAERAHHELVEALWTRLSPQVLVASLGFAEASNGPPVAAPLGQATAEVDVLPFLLSVCSDPEEMKLMESTLTGARLALHTASMKPALRSRLLLMLCAVLRLPMHAAVACDACWREAVTALCMLSSSSSAVLSSSSSAVLSSSSSADGTGGAQDGACASLAAPKLVQVARVVLSGWADVEDVVEESMLALRAAQLVHLLSHLSSMRLAEGALPAPNSQGRSIPARIAPAMIKCIGEPKALFARGKVPAQVLELQSALRTSLQGVASELGLGSESSVSSVSSVSSEAP